MKPAIFLDRDGTLIDDRGYLSRIEEAVFYEDTVPALQRLHGQFELFIVTNQSGIGLKKITAEDAARVNAHVVETLSRAGIVIRETYVCPHTREDGCACHKPKTLFLQHAARDYGIDLSRSFVIGDHPADVYLADAAGATGIYVLSGHGAHHLTDLKNRCPIAKGIGEAIEHLAVLHGAAVLRRGGLVAFATETVYGLGANAEDPAAISRIFSVKGRPPNHPLIVHLANRAALDRWAKQIPPHAEKLAEKFWPGALTMILEKSALVPLEVTGGQNTVGLRVPAHDSARALIAALGAGAGAAAPSANKFGRVSPTEARHVLADLGSEVDFVLDGGPCAVGIESTIVDLASADAPLILRPGGVSQEAIEEVLGCAVPIRGQSSVRAPGLLPFHYAPNAEVLLAEPAELARVVDEQRARGRKVAIVRAESAGDLAHSLYRELREADASGADAVVVEIPTDEGIGRAVLDRLQKAAAKPPRAL
jgi:L-threonylcarbamoyladenylate synthase